MQRRYPHGAFWALVRACLASLSLLALESPRAHAQSVSEEQTVYRVVLMGSFQPLSAEHVTRGTDAPMRRGVSDYLRGHGLLFDFISPTEKRRLIRKGNEQNHDIVLHVARSRASKGIEAYNKLEIGEALDELNEALGFLTNTIPHHLLEPEEVAEVALYLGLSRLELGGNDPNVAEAFETMILLDPRIELRRGIYPERIAETYEVTRRRLVDEIFEGPQPFRRDAADLAARTSADLVLYGVVLPMEDGRFQVTLFPYVAKSRRFDDTLSMIVGDADPETLAAAGSRLVSQYAGCLLEPAVEDFVDPAPPSRGESPLSIHINFSYFAYQQRPRVLEEPFGNPGLGFGAQWLFTRDFGLVSGMQLFLAQQTESGEFNSSDPDIRGFQNRPTTVRGFVGAELGYTARRLRLALQLSVDLAHVSSFEVAGDKRCVEGLAEPSVCSPASFERFEDFRFMMGINARPALSYRVHRSVDVLLMGSGSYYFLTAGARRDLNFPLGTEVGLRYRF
ncbi:MAG: hypothetical protein AAGI01_11720 [Myxococcota bacterium]